MKTIELTPREFYDFKKIAKFMFDAKVIHGIVLVTANINHLQKLGF
jgi:hypothetical protein